jgi:hypothetical protein
MTTVKCKRCGAVSTRGKRKSGERCGLKVAGEECKGTMQTVAK